MRQTQKQKINKTIEQCRTYMGEQLESGKLSMSVGLVISNYLSRIQDILDGYTWSDKK